MSIRLTYFCSLCDEGLSSLDSAQIHADETGHNVTVSGVLTSRVPKVLHEEIAQNARRKFFEEQILRLAKSRGLV